MSGVPDHVIFGPDPNGTEYNYGDVRQLSTDKRINALHLRLDKWLIGQCDELTQNDVNAPFPLAIMTCVAIETMGQVLYGDLSSTQGKASEPFRNVLTRIDDQFSRSLTKPQKLAFEQAWQSRFNRKKYSTCGHVVYSFFRNTLIHGYRGEMVYIERRDKLWVCMDDHIVIDPFKLWEKFKTHAYESAWNDIENKKCNYQEKCEAYIQGLLGGDGKRDIQHS